MPMVRRYITSNLEKFVAIIESNHLKINIMTIFYVLIHDGMELSLLFLGIILLVIFYVSLDGHFVLPFLSSNSS